MAMDFGCLGGGALSKRLVIGRVDLTIQGS